MLSNGPFPLPVRAAIRFFSLKKISEKILQIFSLLLFRRPSIEDLRIYENGHMETYSCNCGFNTSNQETFDRHQV